MAFENSVSVVTISYNSAATIRQTIESVLGQTVPCKEYFVIDGCSGDGSAAIAKEYEAAFAAKGVDYRVVCAPDRGLYDAMNKGIAMTTGTLVGLINSDDWYEPIAVETVLAKYRETPFDMMYADLNMIQNEKVRGVKRARLRQGYITTRDWNHPTTFIRRELYDRYHYPCRSVYDDLDVLLKIRKNGHKVVIVNKVLANYRLGGRSNRKNLGAALSRMRIKYRIYRENGYSRLYALEAFGMEIGKWLLS